MLRLNLNWDSVVFFSEWNVFSAYFFHLQKSLHQNRKHGNQNQPQQNERPHHPPTVTGLYNMLNTCHFKCDPWFAPVAQRRHKDGFCFHSDSEPDCISEWKKRDEERRRELEERRKKEEAEELRRLREREKEEEEKRKKEKGKKGSDSDSSSSSSDEGVDDHPLKKSKKPPPPPIPAPSDSDSSPPTEVLLL